MSRLNAIPNVKKELDCEQLLSADVLIILTKMFDLCQQLFDISLKQRASSSNDLHFILCTLIMG